MDKLTQAVKLFVTDEAKREFEGEIKVTSEDGFYSVFIYMNIWERPLSYFIESASDEEFLERIHKMIIKDRYFEKVNMRSANLLQKEIKQCRNQ